MMKNCLFSTGCVYLAHICFLMLFDFVYIAPAISFAVLALNYGMPIESVSKILGHTNITTTQIYAKVTNAKLENDISAFESKISGRFVL